MVWAIVNIVIIIKSSVVVIVVIVAVVPVDVVVVAIAAEGESPGSAARLSNSCGGMHIIEAIDIDPAPACTGHGPRAGGKQIASEGRHRHAAA